MTTCDDRAQRTLDWYTERFERELRDARIEFLRLSELFKDVCWYNFETSCRSWQGPWRASDPDSHVELHAMRFERKWNRGCLIEHGHFPMYYEGPISHAPRLPPQLLKKELDEAEKYLRACETQVTAPYDWAPGGNLYEELRRTTAVGHIAPTSQCVYVPKKRKFSSC